MGNMQKHSLHPAGLQCLSHLLLCPPQRNGATKALASGYTARSRYIPLEDSIPNVNITLPVFPAVAPTESYFYLEPNLTGEGGIKHTQKRKCFDH